MQRILDLQKITSRRIVAASTGGATTG